MASLVCQLRRMRLGMANEWNPNTNGSVAGWTDLFSAFSFKVPLGPEFWYSIFLHF